MNHKIDEFECSIKQVSEAKNLAELEQAIRQAANQLGFKNYNFVLRKSVALADEKVIMIDGMPKGWQATYRSDKLYEHDIILKQCQKVAGSFFWNEIDQFDLSPREKMFVTRSADYGMYSGLSARASYNADQEWLLNLTAYEEIDLVPSSTLLMLANQLVLTIGERVNHIEFGVDEGNRQSFRGLLSSREKECLRWAAQGKTSWEAGQILGIAESTVVHHLKHAATKLGANKRQLAVTKAMELRLLELDWKSSIDSAIHTNNEVH